MRVCVLLLRYYVETFLLGLQIVKTFKLRIHRTNV